MTGTGTQQEGGGARLAGAVVILSGGTRGMGEAMVRGIVAQGGKVVFGGRDSAAGAAIEAGLGGHALYTPLDVRREEDWSRAVTLATQRFGAITGLVNTAGFSLSRPIEAIGMAEIDEVIGINQIGVLLGMKHVVPALRAGGAGSIVNIGSAAGLRAHAGLAIYGGAKAAVVGMSLAVAAELAPLGIRVNVVHPGFFATRLLDEASRGAGRAIGRERTPMGRVAQPEEIVGTIIYLLSEDSRFVTGTQIAVDGGLTM